MGPGVPMRFRSLGLTSSRNKGAIRGRAPGTRCVREPGTLPDSRGPTEFYVAWPQPQPCHGVNHEVVEVVEEVEEEVEEVEEVEGVEV